MSSRSRTCSKWLTFASFISLCLSQTPSPSSPPTTIKPTSSPTASYFSSDDCSVTFDTAGATYDLCPLKIGAGFGQLKYYGVKDSRYDSDNEHYYSYHFNVGDSLPLVHGICKNATSNGYCKDEIDCDIPDNIISINDNIGAWAYQLRYDLNPNTSYYDAGACWHLSDEFGGNPPIWTLIHEEDPTEGVQLTYLNGDYCEEYGKNRKFSIQFVCENNIRFVPDEEPLHEHECEYVLAVPSMYGCPIQCKTYDNQICGGEGLCGYDFMSAQPKCFCYHAYSGDDCSEYDANAPPAESSKKEHPNEDSPFVKTFSSEDTGNVEVTYDLSDFALSSGGAYIVHDKARENFVYYVGIPMPLAPQNKDPNSILPAFCNNVTGVCTANDPITGECTEYNDDIDYAFVWQTDFGNNECYALGTDAAWSLYDTYDDPARGVSIVYSDGSWCDTAFKNREFRINLVCPMDQDGVYNIQDQSTVDTTEYVDEDDVELCSYSFTMETAIACPYQCRTSTSITDNEEYFTVCSQHGICAADPNAGFVRCLCDDGYGANFNCSNTQKPTAAPTKLPTVSPTKHPTLKPTSKSINATTIIYTEPANKSSGFVASIVILVLVLAALMVIGFFCYKKMKLKNNVLQATVDDLEYQKFSHKDDQQDTVVDEKGQRGFATINNPTIGNGDSDNDDQSDSVR